MAILRVTHRSYFDFIKIDSLALIDNEIKHVMISIVSLIVFLCELLIIAMKTSVNFISVFKFSKF